MPRLITKTKHQLLGGLALLMLAALIVAIAGSYLQVFTPAVTVTVVADRSGLLTVAGSDVTLRGVAVGHVRTVRADGNRALLTVALDPSQMSYIPPDVQADIVAPTVFGTKYVNLVPPASSATGPTGSAHIQVGATITSVQVGTEVNTLFSNLYRLLNTIQPGKLDATLGAIADALRGRGYQIGDYLGQLNTYLQQINPSLRSLGNDFAQVPSVARTYAAATPDLAKTLRNLSATSNTLVDKQAQLDAFLIDVSGVSGNLQNFLARNQKGLPDTLAILSPVTSTLARYSPMFPCLFAQLDQYHKQADQVFGATPGGMHLVVSFLPGQKPYENPGDLPKTGVDTGPSCLGGPITEKQVPYPRVKFDDGSNSLNNNDSNAITVSDEPPLAVQLFGPEFGKAGGK